MNLKSCQLEKTKIPSTHIAGEGHKEAKQHVKQQKLAGISKVVGVSKLRTKYEAPEAKRQLCNSYDIFLADERVLPSLPKLLGKPCTSCSLREEASYRLLTGQKMKLLSCPHDLAFHRW